MKQWVKKLVQQLELDRKNKLSEDEKNELDISEDRASLLYILDLYSKNLIDTDKHPSRKVREVFDEFIKALLKPNSTSSEKVLFRLRQFFSSYRIDEYSYIQGTFDDFKGIIWDFADQLSEDMDSQQRHDKDIDSNLSELREAVEANSIEDLRSKSREFIDYYVEVQAKRQMERNKNFQFMKNSLATVKEKLSQVKNEASKDHLTGAFNRRSFDKKLREYSKSPKEKAEKVSLVVLDIDHFKKVNDSFGHDVGDEVIKACVRLLQEHFASEDRFVARIGGEEFAVILPQHSLDQALLECEKALQEIRKFEAIIHDVKIKFTVSMGIAELAENENANAWLKRADTALYESKNSGRNRYSAAPPPHLTGIPA